MAHLGVVDAIASCLRAQLGNGTRRTWSDHEEDEVTVETLAQLVVTCLAAGGWVIIRRADLYPPDVMVLPQRGQPPKRRRVRRSRDER